MLLAFIALIALLNALLGWLGHPTFGDYYLWDLNGAISSASGGRFTGLSFQSIFGFLFAPFAWAIGIESKDILLFGSLLGQKVSVNEFVAYLDLAGMKDQMSLRSVTMATYALCGFANFSSIAIQIGGIGGLAPERRGEIAEPRPQVRARGQPRHRPLGHHCRHPARRRLMQRRRSITDPRRFLDRARSRASARSRRVAVDTEFVWERTYYPRLGLVQLGYRRRQTFLLDPLALDLAPLGALIEDARWRRCSTTPGRTSPSCAAPPGPVPPTCSTRASPQVCAASPSSSRCSACSRPPSGVHLAKTESRTDWLRRPLSDAQIDYAHDDVRYLAPGRAVLDARITEARARSRGSAKSRLDLSTPTRAGRAHARRSLPAPQGPDAPAPEGTRHPAPHRCVARA